MCTPPFRQLFPTPLARRAGRAARHRSGLAHGDHGRCQAFVGRSAQESDASFLWGILRRMDRHAIGQGRRMGRARCRPFRAAGVGRSQDDGPLPLHRRSLAPMHDRQRQPPQPAVPMLRMVPMEKPPRPPTRRGKTREAVREVRPLASISSTRSQHRTALVACHSKAAAIPGRITQYPSEM